MRKLSCVPSEAVLTMLTLKLNKDDHVDSG